MYVIILHMVRTQIYLSEQEVESLKEFSKSLDRTQSELIREAIDFWIENQKKLEARKHLFAIAGMWRDHDIDPRELRKSWDRKRD